MTNKMHLGGRPPPEVERAHSFQVAYCDDPDCGLHIVALRNNGTEICEIVMSPEQTLWVVNLCKDFLYEKATQKKG